MVFTTEIEIAAFIGAIIGCLVGTLGPYYNKKKEMGWNDIDIFFDRKFLKATVVALILAVIGVGGSFPIILSSVPPTASILTTLITSAVLAMTLNLGGNIVLGPSVVTLDAQKTLLERNTTRVFDQNIENRMSISNKINSLMDTVKKSSANCTCQKCKDINDEEESS